MENAFVCYEIAGTIVLVFDCYVYRPDFVFISRRYKNTRITFSSHHGADAYK